MTSFCACRWKLTDVSEEHLDYNFWLKSRPIKNTEWKNSKQILKKEATISYETWVEFQRTAMRCIAEDRNFHTHSSYLLSLQLLLLFVILYCCYCWETAYGLITVLCSIVKLHARPTNSSWILRFSVSDWWRAQFSDRSTHSAECQWTWQH
jgi:hypothetical protein